MSDIQRVNITLPKKLVKRSKTLIEEGLYSNFSELVRESLKNEILTDRRLIQNKRILNKWEREDGIKGEDTSHLSQEEIIAKIKKMRNDEWETRYKKWFKGL
jgi:Arc/MetJ-type ribon-helix-helix transcriptional regulator